MGGHLLTFLLLLVCVIIHLAESLKCFTCSSLLDDKCGLTWGYADGQADNYIEECVGDTVLCRKLVYEPLAHEEEVVTRSCWNATHSWDAPNTVCKDMTDGQACYCDTGDTPCNGTQLVRITTLNIFVLIFLVLVTYCCILQR